MGRLKFILYKVKLNNRVEAGIKGKPEKLLKTKNALHQHARKFLYGRGGSLKIKPKINFKTL